MSTAHARQHLLTAARLALRGHGRAEPNPLVGCVIVDASGDVVGWGYHERCGGPHAEIHALHRAGDRACGATVYVTLEPCNHTGRTGPCTQALIDARVARVVAARRDPHPTAGGGLRALCEAGICAEFTDICPEAAAVSDPFVHRVQTGLPWVIAKWAQTLDGRIATRPPHCESQWISSERSRRMVHRERGRVDVILTGIGTVLRDDPQLIARGVRIRRTARRVVIDPRLQTPPPPATAQFVRTANTTPTVIVCSNASMQSSAANALREAGVDLIGFPYEGEQWPLEQVLRMLVDRFDATNVLVEAGPGLLSGLFSQGLVDEAWVFIASRLMGDELALPAVRGFSPRTPCEAMQFALINQRHRGADVALRYRVTQ